MTLLSILVVMNLGATFWLHVRFDRMPGGTVNVRAVLGAIEAVRVQLDSMHDEDDDHFVRIREKLRHLIDMIDIHILRSSGVSGASKKPPP